VANGNIGVRIPCAAYTGQNELRALFHE
jgi:hypothetical protein